MTEIPLEHALRDLAAGRIGLRALRDVLHSAEVIVPTPEAAGPALQQVSLPVMRLTGGSEAVPLFSSPEALSAAIGDGQRYVRLPFDALVASWPQDVDAVLDPGREWALPLPAHAIRDDAHIDVPAGTRVAIGEPAEAPVELLAALTSHFEHDPDVEAAWCAQVVLDRPGEAPHPTVGIHIRSEADGEGVLKRAGDVARPFSDGATDLLIVGPEDPDPIAAHMLEHLQPFYLRAP